MTQKREKLKKEVIFDLLAGKTEGHFDSFWDFCRGCILCRFLGKLYCCLLLEVWGAHDALSWERGRSSPAVWACAGDSGRISEEPRFVAAVRGARDPSQPSAVPVSPQRHPRSARTAPPDGRRHDAVRTAGPLGAAMLPRACAVPGRESPLRRMRGKGRSQGARSRRGGGAALRGSGHGHSGCRGE